MELEDLPGPEWPDEMQYPTDAITTDDDNPNEMSDEQFTQLRKGMREDGWLQPILISPAGDEYDAEYLIADGEHRWTLAKDTFGFDHVIAISADDWSDADRRMVRQRMNKVHGTHDPHEDALEFDLLADQGKRDEVLDLLDARDESLDEYLDLIRVTETTENPPRAPPQPEVHMEDCVEGMSERLDEDEVDLIVTDPPYGIDIDISDSMGRVNEVQHLGDVAGDHDLGEALELWDNAMTEIDRAAAPGAHLYCFASWKSAGDFEQVIESHGWSVQNWLVWIKKDASQIASFGTGSKPRFGYKHEFVLFAVRDASRPLDGYPDDVFEYTEARWADVEDQEMVHPTQKPVALLEEFIELSSERGHVVLDPFAGSGATGEAAAKLGRDVRLWELEEDYLPLIERRVYNAKRQRDSKINEDVDGEEEEAEEVEADG